MYEPKINGDVLKKEIGGLIRFHQREYAKLRPCHRGRNLFIRKTLEDVLKKINEMVLFEPKQQAVELDAFFLKKEIISLIRNYQQKYIESTSCYRSRNIFTRSTLRDVLRVIDHIILFEPKKENGDL